MIKVSIVIPVFNGEEFISRCLDSIVAQQGDFEKEILVIDDGSVDNTVNVVKKYEKVSLLSTQHKGVATARNLGLEQATGDLILFVDADDALKPGAIAVLVKKQVETKTDIVRFRYEIVRENNTTYVPTQWNTAISGFVKKEEFAKKVYPMFLNGICLNSVCTAMFKKELISDIRFRTDMKTAEDAVFSLAAYTNAKSAIFTEDVVYRYYQHGNSLTGSGISLCQKYKDNYIFAIETMKHLKEWRMNNPINWFFAIIRPIRLTFDKLKRNKLKRQP